MLESPTDRQIIEHIRAGGEACNAAWRFITREWGAYCCLMSIKQTGCIMQEAKQAFSMACSQVDTRIKSAATEDFLKTASLKTYLTTVTIREALKEKALRHKGNWQDLPDIPSNEIENIYRLFQQEECRKLMESALSNIGSRCKKILLLFNDGYDNKKIALLMGLKKEDVAKAEKWKCQEKFKTYLKNHPHIQKYLQESCNG